MDRFFELRPLVNVKECDDPSFWEVIDDDYVVFELCSQFKKTNWYEISYSSRSREFGSRIEIYSNLIEYDGATTIFPAPIFGRQRGVIYSDKETKSIFIRFRPPSKKFIFSVEKVSIASIMKLLLRAIRRDRHNLSLAIGAFLIGAKKEFQQAFRFARGGHPVNRITSWLKDRELKSLDGEKGKFRLSSFSQNRRTLSLFDLRKADFRSFLDLQKLRPDYPILFHNDAIAGCIDDAIEVINSVMEEFRSLEVIIPDETIKRFEDGSLEALAVPIGLSNLNFRLYPERFNSCILTPAGLVAFCHYANQQEKQNISYEMLMRTYIQEILQKRHKNILYLRSPLLLHQLHTPTTKLETSAQKSIERRDSNYISVIIPTRDNLSLLKKCILSISGNERRIQEIIIVDNGSHEKIFDEYEKMQKANRNITVISSPGLFNFSKLCNTGAKHASCDHLIFLNDDTEIIEESTLSGLSAWCSEPSIGAVGPCLLFPNGKIQHVGIVTGMGGIADHILHGIDPKDERYRDVLNRPREVSAITGACLAVRRNVFWEVGCFDAENLPVECNDVDFCLRLREAGYSVIIDPRLRMVHHQSASRGFSFRPFARYEKERTYFQKRWRSAILNDPFFHPAYSLFSTTPCLDD